MVFAVVIYLCYRGFMCRCSDSLLSASDFRCSCDFLCGSGSSVRSSDSFVGMSSAECSVCRKVSHDTSRSLVRCRAHFVGRAFHLRGRCGKGDKFHASDYLRQVADLPNVNADCSGNVDES